MPCGRASDQIEIFCAYIPIYRKYLYILSYPVFLYYAESTKVPPRVFGPLGPKTLRGQQVTISVTLQYFTACSTSRNTGTRNTEHQNIMEHSGTPKNLEHPPKTRNTRKKTRNIPKKTRNTSEKQEKCKKIKKLKKRREREVR